MKKLVFFLFIIFVSVPVEAQFALKGGVSYAKNEVSNYVVTGQFYKELLVLSADLIMPTDLVDTYEDKNWRCGCGVEANLKLFSVLGAFARWSRTFPIAKNGDHDEVIWGNGRSEFSLGIVIDLGRSY